MTWGDSWENSRFDSDADECGDACHIDVRVEEIK